MESNVYITCMGRSGSTLLRQMLNMHPEIIAPPESFFVLHLIDKYCKVNEWTSEIKNSFVTDLYTDRSFRLIWNIPRKTVQQALDDAPKKLSFIAVSNIVRSCFTPSKKDIKSKVFIDKNPIYSILFRKLITAHRSAKVIHLIRDPRGVINGQMHTFKRKDIFALGHLWAKRNHEIEALSNAFEIEYLLVKFEDLVINPKETITKICKFLGVEYSSKILEYNNSTNKFYSDKTKHFSDKHLSTQKPLSKDISEKWRKNLNKVQLSKIAYTTSTTAKKYGYEIHESAPNLFYAIGLSISKMKLKFMISLVRIYFNLPLKLRKSILSVRSMLYDHKYVK